MYTLAVLIGIYSCGIFALGILHILTPANIVGFSVSFLFIAVVCLHDKIRFSLPKLNIYSGFLLALLIILSLINLIGALGPELGFDALWYHLTLPKIWLQRQSIDFLPGPVFRYSVMPKLTETLYAAGLSLFGPVAPKLIHYVFGILSLAVTYKLARKFLSVNYSLLSVVILSGNLVFCWEQSSAYVDLARTFFEILALELFLDHKYTHSAITLGLATAVKIISLASLPIFILLLLINRQKISVIGKYIIFTLLIPAPWLVFSALTTGNPVYPVFSSLLEPGLWTLDFKSLWTLFTAASDPVSPVYIISAPLIFFSKITKRGRGVRKIFIYAGISLCVWVVLLSFGGSRFFLPYLAAFSILTAHIISVQTDKFIKKFMLCLILILTLASLVYRLAANWKYLSVISGKQTRTEFLVSHLNFSFGDYIDTDGFLARTVSDNDQLLVAGINNLYYLPTHLDFTHISELGNFQSADNFDYLLIRQPDADFIPTKNWTLINKNSLSRAEIYRRN